MRVIAERAKSETEGILKIRMRLYQQNRNMHAVAFV